MRKKADAILDEIQHQIKQGNGSEMRAQILELGRRRRFPRHLIVRLASLARQSYLHEEAVRLLRPRVKPTRGRVSRATDEERAEYGMALASLGSGAEALQVLQQLATPKAPWIFFGLVLAYFRQFRWADAIPLLEDFLSVSGLSAKDQATAERDLSLALTHGKDDYKSARALLQKARKYGETHGDEHFCIEGDVLLAQNLFMSRDWKGALEVVGRLEGVRTQNQDAVLGLRIELIAAESTLMGSPQSAEAQAQVAAVRRKLEKARLWARLRELDLGEFMATGDRDLLWRLYFGTYHPQARARYLRLAGLTEKDVPDHYDWRVPGKPEAPFDRKSGRSQALHLFTGENDFNPKARFKEGQVIQRTLQSVVMDLYTPATSISLFERIYPGESFVPVTSMLKVRQSLWQLRQWLLQNKIPLEVVENNGNYWLVASQATTLRIPSLLQLPGGAPVSAQSLAGGQSVAGLLRVQSLALRARERFGHEWFSAPDFASTMSLSERSAQRYLKLGVEERRFEAIGGGTGRRYRVAGT